MSCKTLPPVAALLLSLAGLLPVRAEGDRVDAAGPVPAARAASSASDGQARSDIHLLPDGSGLRG